MRLLLDRIQDNDMRLFPAEPFVEEDAERFDFETTKDGQIVTLQITGPITVQKGGFGFSNGAVRVYLDGDGMGPNGKQWNGFLICNAGAWCFWRKLSTGARFSACYTCVIPNAGRHMLHVRAVASTKDTNITLRGRRQYQVVAH